MSLARIEQIAVVERCIPRIDGGWMVLTRNGPSAVASREIPEGTRIVVRDGKAYRPK